MEEEAHKIAQTACKHFQYNLPKKGKPSATEWTTYSAIVQSIKDEINSEDKETTTATSKYKVVAVGTGTKCLGRNEISSLGDLVSDSHAEVLARRSFLLYLYNQMELTLQGQESILDLKTIVPTPSLSDDIQATASGKIFCLLQDVTFHIFISHLPCGDAAIIPSTSLEVDNNSDGPSDAKKPKIDQKVVSRTGAKLEAGPLVYEDVQMVGKCRIKPGKGDPTLCMSCSDKIAKWQILGLQGSLVGNLIPEPIRLSSVIIGSSIPFSKESVERAIYTRFSSVISKNIAGNGNSDFLKGYFKPIVAQASMNFMDLSLSCTQTKSPSPGSIIWNLGSIVYQGDKIGDGVQVIVNGRKQGATKKNFGRPIAMVDVCRAKLFEKFIYFRQLLSSSVDDAVDKLTYSEAKKLNKKYLSRWSLLRTDVMFGWTVKPS